MMKEQVLKIVKNALGNAEDDLYRANLQFNRMTKEQQDALDKEHGYSGVTYIELLRNYSAKVDELKACVAWIESKE